MEYSKVLEALGGIENGGEMIEAIKGEVTKKNNEAYSLRQRSKAAEEKLSKIQAGLGIDPEHLDDSINSVKATLEAVNAPGGADALTKKVATMEATIKKLSESNEAATKAAEEERAKRRDTTRSTKLREALAAANVLKPDVLATVLEKSVTVKDDDSVVFAGEDGAEIALADGIKTWVEQNPEFVSNSQKPGAGGPGGGGNPKKTDLGSLSVEEYMKAREINQEK